jgi:hypothetical protein
MTKTTDRNPKGAGRKKIELDTDMLIKLAELQCTHREIAYVMNCSTDTLKRNYADHIDKGYAQGKIKLRRAMFRNAVENDNAVVQIFLSKNILGYQNDPALKGEDNDILPWESDDK